MSRPTWPTTRYRSNTATNTARRSRADRPHRPVVAHGPTAPRRPLVHTVRCIPPGGMSGAYHLTPPPAAGTFRPTSTPGRRCIPPDSPHRPVDACRTPPPARRCTPLDCPTRPVGAFRPTAAPSRRSTPPNCSRRSVVAHRLTAAPVGAYHPTARRGTPPDCPPPLRRCIPPDGPCQPVVAYHPTSAAFLPPFGAWRVGYIALSQTCFTPYRLPAAALTCSLTHASSDYRASLRSLGRSREA